MRLTVEDDDLWGPPLVVEDDTFRKQTMRGCEFWFDCRTDVLEENFQNEKYCELAWRILSEKKQDVEIDEVDKDSVSIQNDMVSFGSGGDSHDVVGSSDSDKTLSTDTSSAKSVLDEDENASSISDAQTVETRDSSNETEEIELETRLEPQETAANGRPLTVEVSEDADISSCPVLLTSKVEEAEEHSCSSLVTDQVLDPIKQALENKSSSSAISRENTGGSTLRPLLLEIGEKVREEANAAISREDTGGSTLRPLLLKIRERVREKANAAATNKDVEIVKDHQQNDGLQDIVTVSEPFTTESLLDLCDEEPDKGREMACDERSEQTHIEAVKTVVKEELIITLLNEAREKAASKALLNPVTALIKKRKRDNNKGMNTNFIRNIKKKVKGEAGEIIIRGSSVPPEHADSLLDSVEGISRGSGRIVSDSVMSISTSELKNKTGKELRSLAKELKVTQYYKLKKEGLVQRLTNHINQLTECKKQRMESEPISLVLYWLSGLTCTDENFIIKSGAQRAASTHGIALVAPDTSPRGLNVEGEADSYDLGVGAGFYLNATQEKWKNWRMYDYVVKELPKLLSENFSQLDTTKASISGHSMGGHGALTIYLKNLDKYKSVSAFAPIANPINCPWGHKAFTNYLGDNKAAWEEYDATCLISKFNNLSATILIDQGENDSFYPDQLLPSKFEEACKKVNAPLLLRLQPGYDHSYYFIATFIEDHISHHAQALKL